MSSTYYIDADSGSNANDGSESLPWETLSYAHGQASSGDTIICKTATASYTFEDLTFAKNLTIEGEDIPSFNPITSTWTGAIFDGGGTGTEVWWDMRSYQSDISNIVFTNCANLGYWGIFTSPDGRKFENCVFYDMAIQEVGNNRGRDSVFKLDASETVTVVGCLFYEISGACVFGNYNGDNSSFVVYNSQFYVNVNDVFQTYSTDGESYTAKNCVLESLTSTNNVDGGDWSTANYSYGCAYNFDYVPSGDNNITSDPKFIDPVNGDFRLQGDSPCIGAGDSV